jgi:hypothetical protein
MLDVLSGLSEIKVCVGYEIDGKQVRDFPSHCDDLRRAKPVYETLPGWETDVTEIDREEDLQLITFTIDGLSQPIEDREIVISEVSMDYILSSIKYFMNLMQMEVESVRYLPVAREVHLNNENDLALWLSTEKDYKEQIDKLHTIYKVAELEKEDLAYIDLRIKEKIIYCPSGAACDR